MMYILQSTQNRYMLASLPPFPSSTASYQIHQMLFQAFGFYSCSKFTNKDIFYLFDADSIYRPQHELQEFFSSFIEYQIEEAHQFLTDILTSQSLT